MRRYIQIYIRILKLNTAGILAYRANFINSIASSFGWGIVSILAIFLLTSHTSNVFGWSREELFLLVGIYNILNGIFVMFFARNFERFSRLIHFAQIDSVLTKPIDSQFLISLSLFNITGLVRVLVGGIFTAYIINALRIQITFSNLIEFLLFLILSMIIFYSVWFFVLTIVIWFSNLTNLVDFLYVINNLGRYPSKMIYSTHNLFLLLFLPLTFMASIPAKALLSNLTLTDFVIFISTSLGMFFMSRKFYFFALKSYTSASS